MRDYVPFSISEVIGAIGCLVQLVPECHVCFSVFVLPPREFFRLNMDEFIVWRKCRQSDTTDDDTEETLHSENVTEFKLSVLLSAPQSASTPTISSTPIIFYKYRLKKLRYILL